MFGGDRKAYYDSKGRPINLIQKYQQKIAEKNKTNPVFHQAANAEEIWHTNIRNLYRNKKEVRLFKGYISHSLDYDWIKPYCCRPYL